MKGQKLNLVGRILLSVVSTVVGIINNANAAEIKVINYTTQPTNPKVDNMSAYFRTFGDANERWDYHDGSFLDSPEEYALEISSNEPSFKAKINAKPFNTPYAKFDLGFFSRSGGRYPGSIDNKLRLIVKDPTGLEHRKVIAYDISKPNEVHDVPKNGDILEIPLPDLVNPPVGVYATWHIATPSLVPGDIASAAGVGKLDGKRDFWDIKALSEEWLQQTFPGENYLWGDVNYDGINNLADFGIMADSWMKEEQSFD